ncbi:putative Ufm1-specific protease-like, partial [Trifolium medium]|nr:putative Ufm1-specific protease-like [Trifolium medium]
TIQVSVLFNSLGSSSTSDAPIAEYLPVLEEARLIVVDIKLDVLCYSSKELPLRHAVSCLIIPSLTDQLNILQNFMLPNLLAQHPQVRQWVHLSSYIHFPWYYFHHDSKSQEDHFPN